MEKNHASKEAIARAVEIHAETPLMIEIINAPFTEAHSVLKEDFAFTNRIERFQFIAAFKAALNNTHDNTHDNSAHDNSAHEISTPKTHTESKLLGEKSIKLPSVPKAAPGQPLCDATSWKMFFVLLRGWTRLHDKDFELIMAAIFQGPDKISVAKLYKAMTPRQQQIDAILGTHFWAEFPLITQRLFPRAQDYQAEGNLSAVAILSFLGQKIHKKCSSRFLALSDQFYKRKPVESLDLLFSEINTIVSLSEDLALQDQEVTDTSLFTVLHNAIKKLIIVPALFLKLAIPVQKCQDEHKFSGKALLETLRDVEFNITNDPELKPLLKTDNTTAASAAKSIVPKGHLRSQSPGTDCINKRELGECNDPKCKAKHDTDFPGTPCSDPVYLETGICPNFLGPTPCKFRHNKPRTREELIEKRNKAIAKYPDKFSWVGRMDNAIGYKPQTSNQ